MKRFLTLLFAVLLGTVHAQTLGVFKSNATATKNDITEDLNIGVGRTLTVKSGGVISAYSGTFGIRSSAAAFDLKFLNAETLTANRNLTLVVGNANRMLTLSGDPTLGNWFDQDVKTTASPAHVGVTLSGTSANTLLYSNGSKLTASVTLGTGLTLTTGTLSRDALTGDLTTTGNAATLATVNANVGTWGTATQVGALVVNGKGLVTGASHITITPAWSSLTGVPTSLNGMGITNGTALDALGAVATTGLLQRTAANTYSTATFGNANLSWTAGVLSMNSALIGINSVTSTAGQNLVLATGTFGTSVTFASATGIPTFATSVLMNGVTTASAGALGISSSDPSLRFKATGTVVVDQNTFEIRNIGTTSNTYLQFRTVNDANNVFTTKLLLWQSGGLYLGTATNADPGAGVLHTAGGHIVGGTISSTSGTALVLGTTSFGSSVSFASATGIPTFSTAVTISGALTANSTATVAGTLTSTANAATLGGGLWSSAATPRFVINQTGASTNQKLWDFIGLSDGTMRMRVLNDADTSAATIFQVTRTATTVNTFDVSATTSTFTGNLTIGNKLYSASGVALVLGTSAFGDSVSFASSTGVPTFATNVSITGNGTGTRYLALLSEGGTYAGNYILQAGGGSAAFGGGLIMYGHAHGSKPGWVTAGISSGSGGKFSVNANGIGTGTDVFTIDANGATIATGYHQFATAAGSGSAAAPWISSNGSGRLVMNAITGQEHDWQINNVTIAGISSTFLFFGNDNTINIGAVGANRPKDYFGAGNITLGGSINVNATAGTASGLVVNSFTTTAGNVQYWSDFKTPAGGVTLARFLRGNGAAGYNDSFNVDVYAGFQATLNSLGGASGTFDIKGGNANVTAGSLTSVGLITSTNLTITAGANARVYWNAGQTAWTDYNGTTYTFRNSGGNTPLSIDTAGVSVTGAFSSSGLMTASAGLTVASGQALTLGNAYVATPQVPTGYIVIKDSTGTAYKVPANL